MPTSHIPVVENGVVVLLDVAVRVDEMTLMILSHDYCTYIGTKHVWPDLVA